VIHALMGLLVCQLAGEVIVRLAGLPVPGPVMGMGLMLVALMVKGDVPEALEKTAGTLLANLSLLFVPAGVGVMVHAARIGDEWLALGAGLIASTALAIAVAAVVFRFVAKVTGERE